MSFDKITETRFGFMWGPVIVSRDISDPKLGCVISLFTKYQCADIRVSPTGRVINVTQRKANEYEKEQIALMEVPS